MATQPLSHLDMSSGADVRTIGLTLRRLCFLDCLSFFSPLLPSDHQGHQMPSLHQALPKINNIISIFYALDWAVRLNDHYGNDPETTVCALVQL